ncbi:signal peptidase II [Phorcysia thermohydrogeniphila]|uniref:Lipoprotein signal peptidase n=1 Tax=Phorcysia thermohydrogeniphila TaxID=936138 RepID=A0A4R1GH46_9BACT|nr:signal peptidase II [Phorcysia thermohydrogeniphila]TCK06290.1 signal peptidase II [Phorcysia thermohydrogeniphila]
MKKLFLAAALFSFVLDRVTKFLAVKFLYGKSVTVIPHFFSLRYAENPGAAFSILSSGNEILRKLFLIVIPILIVVVILYYGLFKETKDKLNITGLGLILGGAVGNLYDRILHGKVIDFFDFYIGNYHYPTFNVADTCVFLGCLLLVLHHYLGKKMES